MFIEEKKTFAIEYKGKVIGSLGIEEYDENELPEFKDKKGREIGSCELKKDLEKREMQAYKDRNKTPLEKLFNSVYDKLRG